MLIRLLSIICILYSSSLVGQEGLSFYEIKAIVIDKETTTPLPYATIFNRQQLTGTATNENGYFELPACKLGDTLLISYLGYEKYIYVVSNPSPQTIALAPNTLFIDEITITADDNYLYDMVSKVSKNKRTKSKTAKTYFYLESELLDSQVEIIEAYYNGEYTDHTIEELHIKKGRIASRPFDNKYFLSAESSKLFSMHNLFERRKDFPINPFSLGKRALKKKYFLDLIEKYKQGDSEIYVITYKPRNTNNNAFQGTIWIDRNRKELKKIHLSITDTAIHPFIPWPSKENEILQVDMDITKTYSTIDSEAFLDGIDFIYNFKYLDRLKQEVSVKTQAYLKPYDYNASFSIPMFDFSKQLFGLEDYRDMSVAPYDSIFWNNVNEFRLFEKINMVDSFMEDNYMSGGKLITAESDEKLQLEFPYLIWNKDRIEMKEAPPKVITRSMKTKEYEADRYHLNIKLYMDCNTISDFYNCQTVAILDPVDSYFHFYMTNTELAFINMNFDLMEIQRRKLEEEINSLTQEDLEKRKELHNKNIKAYQDLRKQFVRETNRGKKYTAMKKWNLYILDQLEVDNFKVFDLYDKK